MVRPEQAFIIVERQAIPQASLLKVVDMCFKLFYVLDIIAVFSKSGISPGRGEGKRHYIWLCPLSQSFLINK